MESSTSSSTSSMGLDWGTAWKMAGSLGAKMGHSEAKEVSKAVEITVALPPHTETTLEQETSTTTYNQTYQQPVILNYKVAIFAMSGDFYSSSAFGGIGGINGGNYDKQSLVIKFDTKASTNPTYGCAATDDLYGRVVTNKDVSDYDVADSRTYNTQSSRGDWSESKDINWDSVIQNVRSYYGWEIVGNVNAADDSGRGIARTNFFYETPGKLNVDKDKTTSKVKSTLPLYNLASVATPQTSYTLYNNNTLDLGALTVAGYDRFGVPFYGFKSSWGEWKFCDQKGKNAYDTPKTGDGGDPVTLSGTTLTPIDGDSGIIYLTWVANNNEKPITSESPTGQDLVASSIAAPVVTIRVVNSGLDNPTVTASGSYTGFYRNTFNLNDVITYEVTSEDDKVIDTQVKWETRKENIGITVNENGDVSFSKPGAYLVRPYVYKNVVATDNTKKKVYPGWLVVAATEHDLTHYDAKAPTNCVAGNADGWIEHYRCSDCGKYFSDEAGKNALSESDVIIPALGHDWDKWELVKEDSGNNSIVEQHVCKNNSNHQETREVSTYTVKFDMKNEDATVVVDGEKATAIADQTFRSDAKASVEIPANPTAEGFTFEGWYTSENDGDTLSTEPYDFSTAVTGNLTLYAKWAPVKYAVATTAVVLTTGSDGEQKIAPADTCSVAVNEASAPTEPDEDGYSYCYTEVEKGGSVTVEVKPGAKYSFAEGANQIQAVPVNLKDMSTGDSIQLAKVEGTTNKYTFTMPAADVVVAASFSLTLYAKWTAEKRTVTFDANGHGAAPAAQTVDYDSKAQKPANPTAAGYVFGGWFTDQGCTKAYNFATAVTANIRLYAKWTRYITPAKVGITSASSALKSTVAVSWGAANDANGYEVAVGGIITSVAASQRSVTVVNTKLVAGKKYDVMVRAWHMNGTTKTYGSWSAAKKVTISKAYNAQTKKKIKAYKKANAKSAVKATLKKGMKVKVLKESGKWAQTNKGWVLKANLKVVKIVNTAAKRASAANANTTLMSSGSSSTLMAASIG